MGKATVKYLFILISFVFLSAESGTLFAQDKNWKDSAELSYVQTGGNTDVQTFSGNNSLKYDFSQQWSGTWDLGLLYGKTDGVKNAERYFTDLRIDYEVSETLYCFALGGWEKDEFAGLQKRVYLGPGAGYNFLTGERHYLSAEGGLNYARETYTDDTGGSFLEGRLQGKYEYVFNPKTKFTQSVEYLQNFDDIDKFRVNTVTGLTTQLTELLSMKVTYEINYQNEPSPETLKKTDTRFSAALVVNF